MSKMMKKLRYFTDTLKFKLSRLKFRGKLERQASRIRLTFAHLPVVDTDMYEIKSYTDNNGRMVVKILLEQKEPVATEQEMKLHTDFMEQQAYNTRYPLAARDRFDYRPL